MEHMEVLHQALARIAADAHKALATLPTPVPEGRPRREVVTDQGGDTLTLRREGGDDNKLLSVKSSPYVHLDQDAVNRLARYLDHYRTDTPRFNQQPVELPSYQRCSHGEATGSRCCRLAGHDGGHVPSTEDKPSPAMDNDDPAEVCAGYEFGEGNSENGCGHARGRHGAYGCVHGRCPCTRRGGR